MMNDPARMIVDDSGFPRTPDRHLKFYGTHAQPSEVFETMTGACGPYYLGGSTMASIRAFITKIVVVLLCKL
jgi:hypothetical protein